ncbi:MAG: alpha-glucosidase C-terminal domain-containing protein [Porphyromonadaceae bacterium]|nr:MAG: alpha-glucosidase C-terminal domain-containing protein [Porphyromonadaceae bacterium]
MLRLCNGEKAISEGAFFDLMYVNYHNLNPNKQYLYLRHYETETPLIAVNFDSQDATVYADIPQRRFRLLEKSTAAPIFTRKN